MLLQFLVENYRSFRDETVLSMVAPEEAAVGPPGYETQGPGGLRVLRCAAIYGPNASGKSNLIEAFATLRALAVDGARPDKRLPHRPFALEERTRAAASRFEVEVWHGGWHYSYGLVYTALRVESEWLYLIDDGEPTSVFERESDRDDSPGIVWGPGVELLRDEAGETGQDAQFLRFLGEGTRPNQPLLAECGERNVRALKPLREWFAGADVIDPSVRIRFDALQRACGPVGALLGRYDTGVADVRVEASPAPDPAGVGSEHDAMAATRRRAGALVEVGGELHPLTPRFVHVGAEGPVELGWGDESDGTQRLIDLEPLLREHRPDGSRRERCISLVDELDRSLHATLTRRFIRDFVELAEAGGSRRQLIFTTHDTSLLDPEVLPVASIRFVEKGRHGASTVYGLADFEPKQLEHFTARLEQSYLQGRFGAIPFVADRSRVTWAPQAAS